MGILNKLSGKLESRGSNAQQPLSLPPAPQPQPPNPSLIPRYRKQRGVNLGSWFVLEGWMAPSSVFRESAKPGQSDLDVVKGGNAKSILEEHWDNWIGDEDWKWIQEHGYNSVRIPIGFYHLCGAIPDVLKKTPFEAYHQVFEGAWGRIQAAIRKAESYGIGVFIDLHSAAGGQNTADHSGTSNGKASLFSSQANLRSTSLALRFLASTLAQMPNVVGLELVNEPDNHMQLQGWYEQTIAECRQVAGADFAIYISDAWDPQHYCQWVGGRDDWVVMDHHLYRCHAEHDQSKSADQHIQELKTSFGNTFQEQCKKAKGNVVVGEFSAALNPRSMPSGIPDGERDRYQREFVGAELEMFEKYAAGWWFWTYKKGEGWDAGWSAKNATQAEILPAWVGSRKFKGSPSGHVKDTALQQAYGKSLFLWFVRSPKPQSDCTDQHQGYWQSNGGSPDHTVFPPGFSQGWDDQLMFLSAPNGPSELGFVDQWALKRKREFEQQKQLGGAAWEWEEAFRQGVDACKAACLE